MSVFVVVATREPDGIKERIKQAIQEGDHKKLNDNSWLVSYNGTSQDLTKKLGILGGVSGSGIVFLVSNYSGYASTYIWEWLSSHPEARGE